MSMRRKYKACRALAAAGNEAGVSAIVKVMQSASSGEDLQIAKAFTLSQIRQKISPYSGSEITDILVMKFPLEDGSGIDQILDLALKNSHLQTILLVRRDVYEQVSYRCRDSQIFVLSLPVQLQLMTQALRFMMAMSRGMAERYEEVLRLRKKLSEIGYITKAKCLLIQHRGMSEEEAHYYLERMAMNRCLSKKEIALEIIDSAEIQGTL